MPSSGKAARDSGVDFPVQGGRAHEHSGARVSFSRAGPRLLEGGEPAVPHEDGAPRGVDDGRRVAAELRHAVTDADRQAVAPTEARAVTARAGLRRRHRKPRVEIELLAELSLFRR